MRSGQASATSDPPFGCSFPSSCSLQSKQTTHLEAASTPARNFNVRLQKSYVSQWPFGSRPSSGWELYARTSIKSRLQNPLSEGKYRDRAECRDFWGTNRTLPINPVFRPELQHCSEPAPQRRQSIARGVSPWDKTLAQREPRRGGRSGCVGSSDAPPGLSNTILSISQGLTPLAINCRRCGATCRRVTSPKFLDEQKGAKRSFAWPLFTFADSTSSSFSTRP